MHIPDLRKDFDEITIEHCAVLLERLRDHADLPDGERVFGEIIDEIDLTDMRDILENTFNPQEFHRLFVTDIGKGVLIGIYMDCLFNDIMGVRYDSEQE